MNVLAVERRVVVEISARSTFALNAERIRSC
jgi:hypothetical protein